MNYEDAGKLLSQSAGNVKVAIVMSRLAIDRRPSWKPGSLLRAAASLRLCGR